LTRPGVDRVRERRTDVTQVPQVPAWLPDGWQLALIPIISGVIGYGTNWVAIRLLFRPVDLVGVRLPGLKRVAPALPRRLQQIPGVLEGRLGWQGIIPYRSARMGSIAAEKGVAKIGTQEEFYDQFDPERLATQIVTNSREEMRALTDEILREEYPDLWASAPDPVREFVHERVQERLPRVAAAVTEEIGANIDELLDSTQMITEHLDDHPELVSRLFLEVGDRELQFIINSGFYVGIVLGSVTVPLFLAVDRWWLLPVCGMVVGYLTNWIALKIIFRPVRPKSVGPFELQGLFIRRQPEAAEKWAEVVAEGIVTIGNVADNLLYGAQSDRTRRMIRETIRPEVDDVVGAAAPVIRTASGSDRYERLRETFAEEGVDRTIDPLREPEFNEERGAVLKEWMTERIRALPPEDFVELLRPAFEEDEWMLILLGAVLGFVAGWIQLLVVSLP
jgi:uncharacterized membrane protein YheB (UPF0754 family)